MSIEGGTPARWVIEVPHGPERDVIAESLCAAAVRMCAGAYTDVRLHPLGSARVRMSFPDEESGLPVIARVYLQAPAHGLKIFAEPPASTTPTSR